MVPAVAAHGKGALVGTDVLFVSQNATNTLGVLGKVDAAGVVTTLVDFGTVTGFTGLVNALAVASNHACVGAFDSGSSASGLFSSVWDVNLATNAAVKLADLPRSRFNTGGVPFNAGVVQLLIDPNSTTTLVVQGVYGDLYRYSLTNGALIDHRFSAPAPCRRRTASPASATCRSPPACSYSQFVSFTHALALDAVSDGRRLVIQ